MTPKERAALNDRGRRRLGRAIAIVARDHIDNTVPSTEAHHAALWAERNKANMTTSEMHRFWIDDCEPSKKTITAWTKAKKCIVDMFGDATLTGVTRTYAPKYRAALRNLPKTPKPKIAKVPARTQNTKNEGKGHGNRVV